MRKWLIYKEIGRKYTNRRDKHKESRQAAGLVVRAWLVWWLACSRAGMGAGASGAWACVYYIGMSAAGRRAGWRSGRAWWVLGGLAVGVRGVGAGVGQGGNTTDVAAPKKQGVSGAKLKFSGLTDFNK